MRFYASAFGLEKAPAFFGDMIDTLTERGRNLLSRRSKPADDAASRDLTALGDMLLSRRGEASGVAVAQMLLASFEASTSADRLRFLQALAEKFGPDRRAVELAVETFRKGADRQAAEGLHAALEPRRQELIRRLNLAPGGTSALIAMREALLTYLAGHPGLNAVDSDFVHLFSSWFNRGFLVLRPIDWTTPANILEKIIKYEAVHAIKDWQDLRNRLEPEDRRCFGFFHPQLIDEPLIFVEVALTKEIPASISPLLDLAREPIAETEATTAVFYSISNTQKGLGGVSFGNFLIKQVVQDLTRDLPGLQTFVTLSPVPTFANWLARERKAELSLALDEKAKHQLQLLDEPGWHDSPEKCQALREPLLAAAAYYFLKAKTASGRPIDPVARFHLGNGARLERLNFLGDVSANGLKQSHGLMVNYLYALQEIESNHEAFAEHLTVAAAASVKRTLRANLPSTDLVVSRSA
jgi:malonyl-CoA decarboxylase